LTPRAAATAAGHQQREQANLQTLKGALHKKVFQFFE
jgi:hypothetical protein